MVGDDEPVVLHRGQYEVRPIALQEARRLCEQYHYARGCGNTAVYVHGLFRRGASSECLAAVIWLPPIRAAAVRTGHVLSVRPERVLMLSRSVAVPSTPKNSMSFLIGRSLRAIAADGRFDAAVTYADEYQARVAPALRIPGRIYAATNFLYGGVTAPRPTYIDPVSGRQVCAKAGRTTRNAQQMLAAGYVRAGLFRRHRYLRLIRNTSQRPPGARTPRRTWPEGLCANRSRAA